MAIKSNIEKRESLKRERENANLRRHQRGGTCSVSPSVTVPCVQEPNLGLAHANFCGSSGPTQTEMIRSYPSGTPTISGGRRIKRSSKRSSKRSLKRRSSKKSRRKNKQTGRGYFLEVNGPRVGGLPEVIHVNEQLVANTGPSGVVQYSPPITPPGYTSPTTTNFNPVDQTLALPPQTGGKRRQRGGAEGLTSVFTDDMTQRTFNCVGPEWGPTCL